MTDLRQYRQWIRTVAQSYAKGDPELAQDYEQEAAIAIWQALQREPDAPPVHLKMVARNRLANCYSRGVWVGQERRAHSTYVTAVPADDSAAVWDQLRTTESPEMAYHSKEIYAAMERLTPTQREYVYLRFWRDYDTRELTDHFGYKPFALWGHPQRGAKVRLQESLAHLRG